MRDQEIFDPKHPGATRRRRRNCWIVVAASVPLVLGACGDDDNGGATDDATDERVATTVPSTVPPTVLPVADGERYEMPLFGGAAFVGPPGLELAAPGEFRVIIQDDPESTTGETQVLVARVSQSAGGQPIGTVDQLLEQLEIGLGATVEPGGEPLEAFGRKLDSFLVTGGSDAFAFSAAPVGASARAAWSPDPHSELFVAQLDDSVMVIAALATTEEDLARSVDLARSLAPSMEITTASGQPEPIGDDEVVEIDFEADVPITPDDPLEDVPSLPQFSSITAGTWHLANLGANAVVEVPDGWAAQPNDPGFVVLTDEASPGPYRDDIRMHLGLQALVPTNDVDQPIGAPIDLGDLEAILSDPPPNLGVSGVAELEVAGFPAIQFDAEILDTSACGAAAPCAYAFLGPEFNDMTSVYAEFAHRFVVVPDFPSGQLVLAIGAEPGGADEWFDRADEVIATMALVD